MEDIIQGYRDGAVTELVYYPGKGASPIKHIHGSKPVMC